MGEKTENKCETCEFFIRHYMRYMGEYIPVDCGTCMCNKVTKEKLKKDGACVFWQEKKN